MARRQMEAEVLKPERAWKVAPVRVFTLLPVSCRLLISGSQSPCGHFQCPTVAGRSSDWEIQTRTFKVDKTFTG